MTNGVFEYAFIYENDWHQQIELHKAFLSWQFFHFCDAPLLCISYVLLFRIKYRIEK